MKISLEIYTLANRFGDFKAVEMAKEAGFDAIDYSYYYGRECDEILGDNYREYAKAMRAKLDEIGMECNQAHAPFTLKFGTAYDSSNEKYLNITRAIESAAILGAKNIVVHSLTVTDGADFVESNVEFYKSFIPYCEKYEICVAVENLFFRDTKRKRLGAKLGSPQELNSIIEIINSPWIVACVDVGHAALTGYEPEKFIEGMKTEYLKCLHVQDNDYLEDRHVLPYSGDLNWNAIMTALKKNGYCGDLTFEIVSHIERFPNELIPDFLKFTNTIGKHLVSIFEKA